ncbi:MAG: type IV pilin protein [Immundisolibacter sp.]|uniref:type IV pilin protein n=1 Tax=Immundisolibacter sp. TaxID=1934948 RepID=UPI0019A0D71C|nr:type IV pilin protein [Immundisolibacter sp.]MBC7162512.1 type IV pilin protein [Immundisolibacter sp.]
MNDPIPAPVSVPKRRNSGFTLVELMIVVAIVAILAAVAYPSYRGFVMRANRSDGKTALMRMAQNMERYFTVNNTYVGATLASDPPAVTDVWGSTVSPDGFYTLSLDPDPTATQYTVKAVAQGTQARDTQCATLTLDQAGVKTPADCW